MTDLRTTMTCPRCGAETTAKARGRPRKWCSDRCRKLASEEHRAARRGVIGLEIRDRIIERRVSEVVYRAPSITASIALLLADVAASKKVLNTLARRVKRDQLDRATIKLLWPHIHELYTEARPRMGLPERPTTVRAMTPAECAERGLDVVAHRRAGHRRADHHSPGHAPESRRAPRPVHRDRPPPDRARRQPRVMSRGHPGVPAAARVPHLLCPPRAAARLSQLP